MEDAHPDFVELKLRLAEHRGGVVPDLSDYAWDVGLPAIDALIVGVVTGYIGTRGALTSPQEAVLALQVSRLNNLMDEFRNEDRWYAKQLLSMAELVLDHSRQA